MTYQLNMGIPDDMAADVKSFAEQYGLSIAAAVRVLLRQGLGGGELRRPTRNEGPSS